MAFIYRLVCIGFVYTSCPKDTSGICEYQCPEGKMAAMPSCHHSELDVAVSAVGVVQKLIHVLWSLKSDRECVINLAKPVDEIVGCLTENFLFRVVREEVGCSGGPILTPSICSCNCSFKQKNEDIRTWCNNFMSSNCQVRRSKASLISTLVKSETTLRLTRM
jgi:hypothetical protein